MEIDKGVVESIVAHARAAAPAECCGVLLGAGGRIVDALRTRNLSRSPNRFLIDPQDHIRALRDGRGRGLAVIGFYHSHPHSPADPSDADRAEVTYPDHLHLIVGLMGERADVRLFRWRDDSFQEAPLAVY